MNNDNFYPSFEDLDEALLAPKAYSDISKSISSSIPDMDKDNRAMLLMKSYKTGDKVALEAVLSSGVSPLDDNGACFNEACLRGNIDAIHIMIKYAGNDKKQLIHNKEGLGFYKACVAGNIEILKLLLSNCSSIKERQKLVTYTNNRAILGAVESISSVKPDISIIKLLVENGADITEDDNYCLKYSSTRGILPVVEYIIHNVKNIPKEDLNKSFQSACLYKNIDIIKLLLKHGSVDVDADNGNAIRWAVRDGHTEVVKLLIDAGADAKKINDIDFRWMRHKGYADTIELLRSRMDESFYPTLEAAGDVLRPRSQDQVIGDLAKLDQKEQDRALVKASRMGQAELVKFILDAGANVHAGDDEALRGASANGRTEVVKLLLDRGADVHAGGDYALQWASANGRTEVVKLLLDAGADVHAKDGEALRLASKNGHTEVVKLLLDKGANVHANDDYALRLASYNGHTKVVKFLLDKGADVHAGDDYALRWASANGRIEMVRLLLDAGANVHADGDYALRGASRNGHIEVVRLLLDAGANVHAGDDEALRGASHNGRTEVVKFLKSRMDESFYPTLEVAGDVLRPKSLDSIINTLSTLGSFEKETLFKKAVMNGDEKLVKAIIDLGLKPIVLTESLFSACFYGRENIVKMLIEEGAQLSSILLPTVAQQGFMETAKILIDAGADVHADNEWALRLACEYGHVEMVNFLLDNGAKAKVALRPLYLAKINNAKIISLLNTYNRTQKNNKLKESEIFRPKSKNDISTDMVKISQDSIGRMLIKACIENNVGIVKTLLDYGADVHTEDDEPIKNASAQGYTELIKVLLDKGADVNADDDAALRLAVFYGKTDAVKLLLDNGANPHARNNEVMFYPKERENADEVNKIITQYMDNENGLNEHLLLHPKTKDEISALINSKSMPEISKMFIFACKFNRVSTFRIILGNLDNIAIITEGLNYAAELNNYSIVKEILDARPEAYTDETLFYAIAGASLRVVEFLLSKGYTIPKHKAKNAMSYAIINNRQEAIKIASLLNLDEMHESIGGAGYSMGSGIGRSFGNPSMRGGAGGRGIGYGGSSNLSGGPNIMYTYSVKGLDDTLQQPITTSDEELPIHNGDSINGVELGTKKKVSGKVMGVEKDSDNNIKWYTVLGENGVKVKVDPTTIERTPQEITVGIEESFYPTLEAVGDVLKPKSDANIINDISILNKFEKDNALVKAANLGKTKVVKLLLDAGADVHAKDDEALRWASKNGYTKVVKLLLDKIGRASCRERV